MPDFGVELHYRWLERIFIWNVDVHFERATFVWSAGWALKGALQLRNAVSH